MIRECAMQHCLLFVCSSHLHHFTPSVLFTYSRSHFVIPVRNSPFLPSPCVASYRCPPFPVITIPAFVSAFLRPSLTSFLPPFSSYLCPPSVVISSRTVLAVGPSFSFYPSSVLSPSVRRPSCHSSAKCTSSSGQH